MMFFMLLLISSLVIIITSWNLWTLWSKRKFREEKRVCVVVLGDIGRSPRMQYHSLSLMKQGYFVDIVGYSGSEPLRDLQKSSFVKIHYLKPVPEWNNQMPRLLSYAIKTIWQSIDLIWTLVRQVQSTYLLLQNPPAIPTIPVCWFYCRFFNTQLIIDWHNYAYSIMALGIGKDHLLVKITMFIESFFGARADKNLCVTNAMKNDLKTRWNIEAKVLYDRPAKEFRPIDLTEKHNLFVKLSETYEEFGNGEKDTSIFTESSHNGDIKLRNPRPALIVSSTSWTEDEDFLVLFTALHEYETACCSKTSTLPDLICAITGKGPLKDFWNAIVKCKKWKHVKIVTPWLSNEDYPKLLASADLGISLHKSTSGLDLPMKVVDMFGCGLPVCAYNYPCLNELVKHEENSLVFSNDGELFQQLKIWFTNFPNNEKVMKKDQEFREQLKTFQKLRWDSNWSTVVLPYFN
ncbi:chitobiosyldiphosphodolichol beta-mannosyltransferase [Chelonus insularis]|uniref:chitobiosyldiphosphodolichol beta-mannosyltransferase n=1 Tax=Chelonus insularis TaxID=460826 RepID=UPI001588BA9A|nr:chitobiosyldiphosphodolichol beta-mannosyltransferase [Chelonus insularis]